VTAVGVLAVIVSVLALAACWRRRAVLGGACASVAGACAVLALVTGDARDLIGSVGGLVVGAGLVVVGEAVWALLSDVTDEAS
jgi:hypothetical protein